MFQNNKVNLIISIVAAIIIWAYVAIGINPNETRTIKNIPVTLKNVDSLEDRDLTIIEGENYTVDVVIRGSRYDTSHVTAKNIKATADVFGYPKGESEVRVAVTVPDSVIREQIDPSSITVKIDEYVTTSKPIKVQYNGGFKNNTEPVLISTTPEELEISGAKSYVKKVSYIEASVSNADVGDTEDTVDIKAVPVDKNGDRISHITLSQNRIDVKSVLFYTKSVPLKVPVKGKAAKGYEMSSMEVPDSVTLKGIKAQLDTIDELNARTINLNNLNKTTVIPLKFSLPDNVELTNKFKDISAKVNIIEAETTDVPASGTAVTSPGVENQGAEQ